MLTNFVRQEADLSCQAETVLLRSSPDGLASPMTVTQLDERGVIETCPHCGQLNRLLFSRLASQVRCGRCKAVLPPLGSHIEIDEEGLLEALLGSSSLPVLVDFGAAPAR